MHPIESIIERSKIIGFHEPAGLILPAPEPGWDFTRRGALVGAQAGLSGIPQQFLDGLEDGETLQRG